MKPDLVFGKYPRYLWQVERYKVKPKWSWRSFSWGFFWGGLLFLVLGYLWGFLAGKGI